MCGIAGFVELIEPADCFDRSTILQSMLDEIAMRGPDGLKVWHGDPAHMGHCRLAIIDLSDSSSQPIRLENDDLVMVYNGEIYNFASLKDTLLALGEKFSSRGDAEVLLRGIKRFGLDWLARLNGMFAGAIWDRKNGKLTLFRDRFGIKPIYWTVASGTVIFASQIKSILRFPRFKPKFNIEWLNEYLTFQNVHGDSTPFAGVHLLEAGQSLVFQIGKTGPQKVKWAPRRIYRPDHRLTFQEATDTVARLFSIAVQNSLVSDVPVGSYLSGGIDSGAVVTVASQLVRGLNTFTGGIDDSNLSVRGKSKDETEQARCLAKLTGSKFHQTKLKALDIVASHQRVLKTIEEPRLGVLYQNDAAARLAASFVKVCLSGAGGDEIFAGYPWRYQRIRRTRDRKEFLHAYYQYWQRAFLDEEKQRLIKKEIKGELDLLQPFETFSGHFPEDADYSNIGVKTWLCLQHESEFFLHGLLQIGDRLAGAYGLEERFPFLDNELMAFVDTIPAAYHWDPDEIPVDGQFRSGKRLLRGALSQLVSTDVALRPKQGFELPIQEWFDGPLTAFIAAELGGKSARIWEFLEPAALPEAIQANKTGRSLSGAKIWSLLSLEAMLKTFFN